MLCFWMAIPNKKNFDQFPSKEEWKCVFSNMFMQKQFNTRITSKFPIVSTSICISILFNGT
jgi:hypothetical protein